HSTPWGAAVAFSGPLSRPVRDFFIDNALYWLEEFQFDGLRFDAVHAIFDEGAPDIISEMGRTVRQRVSDREIHLVLENDGNQPFGTRIAERAEDAALHAGVTIVLLSPQIPLLFMGEEWASLRPFVFFCDFEPGLRDAVRDGRRREFAHFAEFRDAAARDRI